MFHNPGFTMLDAQIRQLERSVSPCEIPAILSGSNTPPISLSEMVTGQLDLSEASSNNPTVVMELDMDCNLRYVSKNWESLVGTSIRKILNKPISNILIGSNNADLHVFNNAVAQMVQDDALYKIKFVTATNDISYDNLSESSGRNSPANSLTSPETTQTIGIDSSPTNFHSTGNEEVQDQHIETLSVSSSQVSNNGEIIELEAQGIMIHDPQTNLPTHSIWTVRPFVRIDLELTIPPALVDLLGFGSEIFEGYLLNLREAGIIEEDSVPEPKTILCRICESSFPAWFIEKHSDLCLLEHKVEEELQLCHDLIADQRELILRISESLWNQQFETSGPSTPLSSTSSLSSSSSTSLHNIYDYKGIPLPVMNTESTSLPRGGSGMGKSLSSFLSIQHSRKFPFGILQRLLEHCDEALLINPADKQEETGELQFSPNSEKAINAVMTWRTLETSDPAIRAIAEDTQRLITDKVDNLTRLISIIKYSDKIKNEVDDYVLQSVKETVAKIREKTMEKDNPELRHRASFAAYRRSRSNSLMDARSDSASTRGSDSGPGSTLLSPPLLMANLPLSQPTNLHSPQPSRARSPTSKIFGDQLYKERDSPPTVQSVTPRDLLRSTELNRSGSSLSPNSSLPRLKDVVDSFNDLDLSRKPLDARSSASTPRRHLSPAPYVEKQSFSTLQRNFKARHGLPPSVSPTNSHLEVNDLISPSLSTPVSVKRDSSSTNLSLPPMTAQSMHLSTSYHSPVVTPSVPNRGSFNSVTKPPLSPLLVSLAPNAKPSSGGIKDYEIIKAISKGAFGSVFLAKRRLTGDYVAIKCLKKRDMIAKNQVLNVRLERAVMMRQADSPYVAQLYSSFQSKDYLYLVMEYLNGGDCATLLKMLGTLGDDWTRRYIAEVIVGVNDLHKRGIIHRDLKPDNLLIDSAGHLKLTDFGLSKVGVVGRQTQQHRKSSNSEHALDVFRKSIHNNLPQSPLVLGSSGPLDSPELLPHNHKRTLSVTPFSLSPATEQPRWGSLSHGHLGSVSSHDSPPQTGVIPAKKRSGSLLRTSNNNRSGSTSSGMESPGLHPTLPRTSSESSFAIVDDDCSLNSGQNDSISYVLFDPNQETHTKKFVGTPDYLAPETISGEVQGEYSDWWSIGCILFEFLFGYPPFHADTPDKVFKNILKGEIDWPPLSEEAEREICSPEAKDLIERLLTVKLEDRLGYGGATEIMEHPYFKDINWDTLYSEQPSSFIPIIDDPESTDYFDSRGADISQFPKDDSDEEIIVPQSAKESGYPHNYLSSGLQMMNCSLPTTPLTSSKRERRGSKLADASEFGSFHFRNLNVLEKANKDVINRLKSEHLEHRNSFSSSSSEGTPVGFSKSRGLSTSSTVVNPGSPFKRPVSPVANASSSPIKEKTLLKRESSGSLDLGSDRPRLVAPSLTRQALHKSLSELIQSPSSSDNEEYSSTMRARQRRESWLPSASSGNSSIPMSVLSSTKSETLSELDVLYCEPIPIVRHTVSKMLEKYGCIVVATSDGDNLIRRATSQVKFDLIITALRLPKIEAIDAVKLIKHTSGVNTNTPVIALTGFAKEALDLGVFVEVLEKPVDGAIISNIIAKYRSNEVAVESDPEE